MTMAVLRLCDSASYRETTESAPLVAASLGLTGVVHGMPAAS